MTDRRNNNFTNLATLSTPFTSDLCYLILQQVPVNDLFNAVISCKTFYRGWKRHQLNEWRRKKYLSDLELLGCKPFSLYRMKEQTTEMCLTAITVRPETYLYIQPKYLTEELAVKIVGLNYRFYKNILLRLREYGRDIDEKSFALKCARINSDVFDLIPHEYLTYDVVNEAIDEGYFKLTYRCSEPFDDLPVDHFLSQSAEKRRIIYIKAVDKDPIALCYVPIKERDVELCAKALMGVRWNPALTQTVMGMIPEDIKLSLDRW